MEYTIYEYRHFSPDEILPLYASVGWTNYIDRPEMLRQAFENSLCTLAVYDDETLVGMIRAVGDGYSTVLVQDLLVFPSYQRKGIGTALMNALKSRYPHVYQMLLLTDDSPRSRGFYAANGFTEASDLGCLAFVKLN
ncbi:MAG: GNAT family N-acetyltransferase [Oscillospiraceae bacterium]|nr:GNAT family N-acetyltransferase [Oscillospiraceae bacterium]